jgi:L-asparaginase/Glu-tRNA(Gln) amidotransferase subunit D
MSNRGGLGRINTENPYISADNLTPQKARVLAMLALAKNPSPAFVAQVMATH